MTSEGGVSDRNLVTRLVCFCFRRDFSWLKTKVETSESLRFSDGFWSFYGDSLSSLKNT